MFEALFQVFKSRDLRYKILFTLVILAFVRVVAHVPLPQIDRSQLEQFLAQGENQIFGILSLFTGGALEQLSIALLGVGPYITGSIIVQVLKKAIPAWDAMSKEGGPAREKLNQYSRYMSVPLAFVQGFGMITLLRSQNVIPEMSSGELTLVLLALTATSVFLMWLGEIISERGIGNGVSLIIALGIISGLPQQLANVASTAEANSYLNLFIFGIIALATVAVIVMVNEAQRKIPITYAKRSVGPVSTTGSPVDSYLPLRVNTAGVIPIIFALSFLTFPAVVARFLGTARSEAVVGFSERVTAFIGNELYYAVLYFLFVFGFTFFYTYIVLEPKQLAENLQKQGGFIPGVRPGNETVSFLNYTISRVTVIGAIFLATIAVLPILVDNSLNVPSLVIGGTGVLIVVSVVVDTSRQIAGQLSLRRYDIQ
jgi:preprotein translocase subunit SecY